MIESVGTNESSLVVEIGPGKGALTGPLLETGATVIAYELDERMIQLLEEKFKPYISAKKLILHHTDILEADLLGDTQGRQYSIVANIPYYITGMILRTMLSHDHPPTNMSLLMQKEVAYRITKQDGKNSILSLAVDFYADARYEMLVKKQYFNPSPKVDSAIISLFNIRNKSKDYHALEKEYFQVVKQAFAQKRKKAINNLSQLAPKEFWKHVFALLEISDAERAENIPHQLWLSLASAFRDWTNDQ